MNETSNQSAEDALLSVDQVNNLLVHVWLFYQELEKQKIEYGRNSKHNVKFLKLPNAHQPLNGI